MPVVSRGSWDPDSHLGGKVLAPPVPRPPNHGAHTHYSSPVGGGAEALRLGLRSWVDEP